MSYENFLETHTKEITAQWRRQGEFDRKNKAPGYMKKKLAELVKYHPNHPMTEAYAECYERKLADTKRKKVKT